MKAIHCAARTTSILTFLLLTAAAPGPAPSPDQVNAEIARKLLATASAEGGTVSLRARVVAAQTLARMGLDARVIIPDLIRLMNTPDRRFPLAVDEALVAALGGMGIAGAPAIPALVRNAGLDCDLDRAITAAVGQILGGPQVSEQIAVLMRRLKDPDAGERLKAAKNLATAGLSARGAVGALTKALEDPDADVRRGALRALEAIQRRVEPTKAVLSVSIRDLTDPDEAVRLRAAKELARLGPAARPALTALQAAAKNDPDEDVRRVAGDAVAAIGGGGKDTGPPPPVPGESL